MDDRDWFESNRQKVIASRGVMTAGLESLGFEVVPSKANFVFARHPEHDAAVIAQKLRGAKIIVRHFAKPKIDQFLRITVGTDDQIAALMKALRAILVKP